MMSIESPSFFSPLGTDYWQWSILLSITTGWSRCPIAPDNFLVLQPGLAAARTSRESFQAWKNMAAFVRQGGERLAAAEKELATNRIQGSHLVDLEKENLLLRAELGRQNDEQAVFRFYGGGGEWFIDGGCQHGIHSETPVYFQGSLVGQVTHSEPGFSEVRTILGQDFRQPVKIGTASARGLLQNSRGVTEVVALSLRSGVQSGDLVLTQGLGAIPPDKPIGTVRQVAADAATGSMTVEVDPLFIPAQIDWVTVQLGVKEQSCSD